MKIKIIKSYLVIATIPLLIVSCFKDKDLDVVPTDRVSDATVWVSPGNADLFLNDIYARTYDGNERWDPFENFSDNSICPSPYFASRYIEQANYNASSFIFDDYFAPMPYFWSYGGFGNYDNIRKCNVFINNVQASTSLTDEYKKKRIGEARFLRAYFYQNLWITYGGVPIITEILNKSVMGDDIFRPRNTSDETLEFLRTELAAAAADLPLDNDAGRATKGAALTLKGWCELFGGRYAESAATNREVIQLGFYELFPSYSGYFLANNNKESIWARQYTVGLGSKFDTWPAPPSLAGWGMLNPTQELIDDYAMANGKVISDPTSGYDPTDPYTDREPRFYETIVYDGSLYKPGFPIITTRVGGTDPIDQSGFTSTVTGYFTKKRIDPTVDISSNYGAQSSYQNYTFFRYAEVLLSYAEAQNEATGPDQTVYDAVDEVRARGGLSGLPTGLSQADMRTAIRRERRVELAFEDKRFWDLIRWRIAEVNLNNPLHGMLIEDVGGTLTYTVVPAAGGDRKFTASKNYLFPIPQEALDKNTKLVQNPGY